MRAVDDVRHSTLMLLQKQTTGLRARTCILLGGGTISGAKGPVHAVFLTLPSLFPDFLPDSRPESLMLCLAAAAAKTVAKRPSAGCCGCCSV